MWIHPVEMHHAAEPHAWYGVSLPMSSHFIPHLHRSCNANQRTSLLYEDEEWSRPALNRRFALTRQRSAYILAVEDMEMERRVGAAEYEHNMDSFGHTANPARPSLFISNRQQW
jgi:hypothetical protein